jgi:heme o synthase
MSSAAHMTVANTRRLGSRSPALARASDYLELAKPRMNLLVVTTTMVGYYMAVRGRTDWLKVPATLLGTALCAGGASVLNQFAERSFDALMVRTRNRPLAARRFEPAEALGFGVGLALGGTAMLALLVNPLTAFLAAFTLVSYVLIYTPLKRRTTLNTIVGALPGAIPPMIGWTAVRGEISPQALALLAILFLWQMPHFLAIAILYRQDYAAAGFRMLPCVDRSLKLTGQQIILFNLALIPATMLPTMLGMAGQFYFTVAVLGGLAFLSFGMGCAASGSRADARKLFLFSIIYLPVLLAVMMLDRV